MARLYFVNGYVSGAGRSSGSAGTATAGNAIAVSRAGLRLGGASGAEPTAVISEARKDGSTIGIVNAGIGGVAHA
jgi:hypothetical protein